MKVENNTANINIDLGRLTVFDYDPKYQSITEEDIEKKTISNLHSIFSELYQLKPKQLGLNEENRDYDKPENVVTLPTPTTILPRSKPVPKTTKSLTKWEEYAKDKGIMSRKKERMVWSEKLNQYLPRWGANNIKSEEGRMEAIIEDKPSYEGKNPFTLKKQDAKLNKMENKKREVSNKDKFLNKKRSKDQKLNSTISQQKKKLELAQKSTASVGRFDKKLKNEQPLNRLKHKKVDSAVFKDTKAEKDRNSKLLSKMMKGGD